MIVVAPYPQGLKLDQTALSYSSNNLNNNGPVTLTKKYDQAARHYNLIKQWCKQNCQGPYTLDYNDILYDGIRVRLGNNQDLAYFNLKWC